eukprot:scaffold64598_cov26-Tisochrysis_lutea.AAC.2
MDAEGVSDCNVCACDILSRSSTPALGGVSRFGAASTSLSPALAGHGHCDPSTSAVTLPSRRLMIVLGSLLFVPPYAWLVPGRYVTIGSGLNAPSPSLRLGTAVFLSPRVRRPGWVDEGRSGLRSRPADTSRRLAAVERGPGTIGRCSLTGELRKFSSRSFRSAKPRRAPSASLAPATRTPSALSRPLPASWWRSRAHGVHSAALRAAQDARRPLAAARGQARLSTRRYRARWSHQAAGGPSCSARSARNRRVAESGRAPCEPAHSRVRADDARRRSAAVGRAAPSPAQQSVVSAPQRAPALRRAPQRAALVLPACRADSFSSAPPSPLPSLYASALRSLAARLAGACARRPARTQPSCGRALPPLPVPGESDRHDRYSSLPEPERAAAGGDSGSVRPRTQIRPPTAAEGSPFSPGKAGGEGGGVLVRAPRLLTFPLFPNLMLTTVSG